MALRLTSVIPRATIAALAMSHLASCNLDAAVFVDPEIKQPAITVGKEALGTSLHGSFVLTLHLGARASGPSQVTIGTFSLKSADQTVVHVENLPFSASPASPIGVAEDSDETVEVTIDTGATLLPTAIHDAICSGQVVISGVIQDSLATGSTPFASTPFSPTCP